jgi:hypothetical protein
MREKNHGGSRRGVEGTAARTQSAGPSYSSNWQLNRPESHRYPGETEGAETDALGSRAQEDLDSAKSPVGKDKADVINTCAHNEPICTQQDCCGATGSLGQGKATAGEEGCVGDVPIPAKIKESGGFSRSLYFAKLVVLRVHGGPAANLVARKP